MTKKSKLIAGLSGAGIIAGGSVAAGSVAIAEKTDF